MILFLLAIGEISLLSKYEKQRDGIHDLRERVLAAQKIKERKQVKVHQQNRQKVALERQQAKMTAALVLKEEKEKRKEIKRSEKLKAKSSVGWEKFYEKFLKNECTSSLNACFEVVRDIDFLLLLD